MRKRKIVGLGEVLWDLLPGGASLGGAPANFAYITRLLGDDGIVASRVGRDSLGEQALRRMQDLGLDTSHVQTDVEHPTGTVRVEIDANGQARFDIAHPVAWDFLEWNSALRELAEQADAVCFGTLGQRSLQSRQAILEFLNVSFGHAIKVFDVNLRQSYYSLEILSDSMKRADIVKVNDEELPRIMALNGWKHTDERSSVRWLVEAYDLALMCVTRGARGSLLAKKDCMNEHPGFRVKVADTVGSGDAFTAALLQEFLNRSSLETMNETANRVGAWVASQPGGMPVPSSPFETALSEITRSEIL
jgi:fructokinase